MLAPRKKLWSTPIGAVDHAIIWTQGDLKPNDSICDIGCGDGRIILRWAELYSQSKMDQSSNAIGRTLKEALEGPERQIIHAALQRFEWNRHLNNVVVTVYGGFNLPFVIPCCVKSTIASTTPCAQITG